MANRPVWGEAALRAALWLLLGGWLGAWTLFAFGVAPVVFRTLPSEVAGAVVGPVLTGLHFYGGAAGVALALLARALGRSRWLVGLPLLMALLCLGNHFGLTLRLDGLRDGAFGPGGSVELAALWWRLHGISMAIYTVVGLLAILLAGLHARADAATAARRGASPHALE